MESNTSTVYWSVAKATTTLALVLVSCPIVFSAAVVSQTPAWHHHSLPPIPLSNSPVLFQRRSVPDSETPDSSPGGFHRFQQVTEHLPASDRLFRSSAPYYQHHDGDQRVTDDSINFLRSKGIDLVISLNQQANNPEIVQKFKSADIAYVALPVEDFHAPTVQNLKDGYAAFRDHASKAHGSGTLVWCGYGHGRTGAMISALQVGRQSEMKSPRPLTRADFDKNHVEKADQRAVLEWFQDMKFKQARIKSSLRPVDDFDPPGKGGGGGDAAAGKVDPARFRNKEAGTGNTATRKPGHDAAPENAAPRLTTPPTSNTNRNEAQEPPVISQRMRDASQRKQASRNRMPGPRQGPPKQGNPPTRGPPRDPRAPTKPPPKPSRPEADSRRNTRKHNTISKARKTTSSTPRFKPKAWPNKEILSKRPPSTARIPKHNGPGRGNNHGGAMRVPRPFRPGGRPGGGMHMGPTRG
ncbi:hypothetical protein CDD82_6597 [Ophiocordyceps australis]|uniref:DSP-PTPase phosphatase fused to NAD+ Kinase domain-containing protein n=1 Tax=Ophiocordyceps australis TaxID=1399860 RepID=A0A2C5YUU5_9HYPO|nr:hypothetical protein CDD82_6597 [Ophiocordyceps australis]